MTNIEIPLGKRTAWYRFFEMLPGILSYGAIILLFVLSFINPIAGSIFVLLIVITMFVKAIAMAFRTIQGYSVYKKTSRLNWSKRLDSLSDSAAALKKLQHPNRRIFGIERHIENLTRISQNPGEYPRPQQIYHGIFVFIYKENYDVVAPTIEALLQSDYDMSQVILILAYEERGGAAARQTVQKITRKYRSKFGDLLSVMHPDNLPNEVIGKGPNATFAGKYFADYIKRRKIDSDNVIVTTLDADNRVEKNYLPYLTYEWIVAPNRQNVTFQPICLFTNNIWDVPAPMRVIAVGNSFWNVISSMRPHLLRNFASHAQGLSALIGMNFWSTRTIVEDGHQYWRSYFHFDGDYTVIPLRVAVGQDAVLADGYFKSFSAQFMQVRRWAYGASDIAYAINCIKHRSKKLKLWPALARWFRLLDSHFTQAVIAPIVAFGGWIPLLVNPESSLSLSVHELPIIIGSIQQVAMIGLAVTIFTSFAMLPPKPPRYKKSRRFLMLIQWVLMPVTSIAYASASAYYSQTRLLFARYFTVFETTEKFVKK
jgi:cellulose synthase/poly-beta-1,6-N-acetylglucosamine synthase-like glycosyltransferase